jgi:integrase
MDQQTNILDSENILLQLLEKKFNITIDSTVLEDIEIMKKKKIILEHEQKFKVWQNKTTGRYMTYLPDKTKPKGRRLVSKSTREHLDNEIIAFYKAKEDIKYEFHTLYLEWLNLKRLEVSGSTIERIHSAYQKFYENLDIDKKNVTHIDYLYLKTFLLSTVNQYKMNYRQYTNFSCVLRGVLQYSFEKGLIASNPFDRFHIGRNVLRQSDTKKATTEVFTIKERESLESAIWNDFNSNPVSTVPLAILLDFYTGLRSGELVTLSREDIQGDYLHIHRTESSYTEVLSDGTKGKVIYTIKESPKSAAGFRDVYITPKARKVLDVILQFNAEHGWDNEFLFLDNNQRIIRRRLDTQIRKYCNRLGITERSMHKIRKYYISVLKLNGIPDEDIKRLAGHRDLTTTYNSYCFSVLTNEESNPLIAAAL